MQNPRIVFLWPSQEIFGIWMSTNWDNRMQPQIEKFMLWMSPILVDFLDMLTCPKDKWPVTTVAGNADKFDWTPETYSPPHLNISGMADFWLEAVAMVGIWCWGNWEIGKQRKELSHLGSWPIDLLHVEIAHRSGFTWWKDKPILNGTYEVILWK